MPSFVAIFINPHPQSEHPSIPRVGCASPHFKMVHSFALQKQEVQYLQKTTRIVQTRTSIARTIFRIAYESRLATYFKGLPGKGDNSSDWICEIPVGIGTKEQDVDEPFPIQENKSRLPKSNTLPGVEVTPLLGILPAVVRRDEAEDEQVAPLEDVSRGA